MVERQLPKLHTRVRFLHPLQNTEKARCALRPSGFFWRACRGTFQKPGSAWVSPQQAPRSAACAAWWPCRRWQRSRPPETRPSTRWQGTTGANGFRPAPGPRRVPGLCRPVARRCRQVRTWPGGMARVMAYALVKVRHLGHVQHHLAQVQFACPAAALYALDGSGSIGWQGRCMTRAAGAQLRHRGRVVLLGQLHRAQACGAPRQRTAAHGRVEQAWPSAGWAAGWLTHCYTNNSCLRYIPQALWPI